MVNLSSPSLRLTFAAAALLLCCSMYSVTCQSQVDWSQSMTHNLYSTIRNVAFPSSPELVETESNIDSRFVLMMPGKVLNYFDYHPGEAYTAFIQNPDKNQKFQIVPPHTMEKWFDLADVVPTANPYRCQDSGRSLANIYKSMLTELKIKNIDDQGEQILSLYNEALDYLNEVVKHPENLTRTTTRLALYNEYKELYNDRRLEMEDKIEMKRRGLQYIEYELWFQRNYPPLQSKVESAYVRWLIFGQKELCDIYITFLDTGSSAKQLEEARIIMRSAGVTALDRTRTIYPVSFEPSDWYEYLLPKSAKPSRAEVQHLLGKIQSEIDYLNYEIEFYRRPNSKLDNYKKALMAKTKNESILRDEATSEQAQRELECTAQSMGIDTKGEGCVALSSSSNNFTTALYDSADSIANEGDFKWADREGYISQLNKSKAELEDLREKVRASIGEVDPFTTITQSDPDVIETFIDAHREDQWMQFAFDSEKQQSQSTYNSYSYTAGGSSGAKVLGINLGSASGRDSFYGSHFQKEMRQSNLKVKGKLLRVFIKRPWFKPEVFDDRNLEFMTNTDGNRLTLGAPGSHLTEIEFIKAMTSGDGDGPNEVYYRLPEYVTSFLLAKEIELELSNINENTARTYLDYSIKGRGEGNFLFFGFKGSVTSQGSTSRTRFYRTANGMKIKVPGAQVIGYYTQKLPKFPV